MKRFLKWLPFGKVAEVSAKELHRLMQDGAQPGLQIIDVRSEQEFAASHIPGAINLPITRFRKNAVAALGLNNTQPVITICLSAHRSIPATRQLSGLGLDCKQLQGGMLAWWKAGLPCIKAEP